MMGIQITVDSATTKQIRDLCLALRAAGKPGPTVKVEGPEHWGAETCHLYPNEFATVVGHLVRYHGVLLAEALTMEES